MEILSALLPGALLVYLLLKPITKKDEKLFKDKNNWRGGF